MQISYPYLYIIENETSIISGYLVFYNQIWHSEQGEETRRWKKEDLWNNSNLNFQIDAAEKLVEDGNKLLKLCVKKMNQKLFLDGQQKIELGQKRKQELKADLDVQKKKRKDLDNSK